MLSAPEHGDAPTQVELAIAVRRDRTRLIPILDRPEVRGLIRRTPDPADRRNRIVALTDAGRDLLRSCRAGIREVERDLLEGVTADDREAFLRVLDELAVRARP